MATRRGRLVRIVPPLAVANPARRVDRLGVPPRAGRDGAPDEDAPPITSRAPRWKTPRQGVKAAATSAPRSPAAAPLVTAKTTMTKEPTRPYPPRLQSPPIRAQAPRAPAEVAPSPWMTQLAPSTARMPAMKAGEATRPTTGPCANQEQVTVHGVRPSPSEIMTAKQTGETRAAPLFTP